ncbi:hypothetical protein GY31_12705 [Lysinibacillus sphaericus]|nr:hypothetical protein GY31_12705 [Lysinibacillus sphaericus]
MVGKEILQGIQGIRGSAKVVTKAAAVLAANAVPDISSSLSTTKAEMKLAASQLAEAARADLRILTDGLSVKSAISSAQNTSITSESVLDLPMLEKVIQLLRVIADKDLSLELDGHVLTNYVDERTARKVVV